MNEDRVMGTARNLGGKVQDGVGRVTGDTKQGRRDHEPGGRSSQDLYGQAKDGATDAAKAVRQGAVDAEDYIVKRSRNGLIRWRSPRFV